MVWLRGAFCSEGVAESRTVLVCQTKNGHAEARFCVDVLPSKGTDGQIAT